MITMTDKAKNKLEEFIAGEDPGRKLRLEIKSGGCSGFSYVIELDSAKENDNLFEDGLIIVDPKSMQYLTGSVIDYQESITGSGFLISNPNTVGSCGCGSSVSF